MKVVLAIAMLFVGASAVTRELEAAFYAHTETYGLRFTNGDEFVQRMEIYAANDATIAAHNANATTFTMAHNQFSHLTHAEFFEQMNLGTPIDVAEKTNPLHTAKGLNGATAVDWVAAKAITPVIVQGSCGSC